jgi:drug/metabolite transporter (DMT)-like permease
VAGCTIPSVSLRSALAPGYLIGTGSLLGFTAYTWLLANAPPVRVATYALVNPLVAVGLGWAVAGEPVTADRSSARQTH